MRQKFTLLTKSLLLLCALVAGRNVWATVPENPVWVATTLADITDNAIVVIISNSDNATNIALPSTTTSSSPAKVACTVTTTNGITTITPPTGKTIQDLAWTISKTTGTTTTYKFYQEGSSTVRLYLNSTSSNTALKVGDAESSNDQFVLGDLGKLLKVTTAARYVGPYDNSGSDWRTYSTENATNYKNAALTFYVLNETTATTTTITSTGITNTDLKNGTAAGSFSATVTVTSGGAAVDGATVTWTSSNTGVATVASNGTVTLVGTGTTTITASYAGNSTYSASSATYNLTVTDTRVATTTTISDAGITNVDLKSGTAAGALSASVKVTSTDAAIDGATVTWTSSDEDVATIAADGTITLFAVGTTTITASYAGGGEYGSSSDIYELTVIDTRQETTITVDNWNTLFGTSFTGSLSGDNLKDYNGNANNVVVNYKKGTGSNMYISGTELRAYKGNSLEFTAPTGYILTRIEFTKGSNWGMNSATPGNLSSQTWTAASSTSTVTFGFSGRTDIQKVVITLAETAPVAITVAAYATYCNTTKALDFSSTGITVYTATDNENSVALNEVTSGKVPANVPVILYKAGADGTAINVPVIASADAISGTNDLRVSDGTTAMSNAYVLANKSAGIGFYPWGGATLSAGKVYLQAKTSYGARTFIGFDEDITSVEAIETQMAGQGEYFNLSGQRVAQPTRGLYIVTYSSFCRMEPASSTDCYRCFERFKSFSEKSTLKICQ